MTAEQIKERNPERIKEKNTEDEDFPELIEHVFYDRFEGFFKYMLSDTSNFVDIFSAYKVCRDALIDNLTENLYFFSSGCTFEAYNLTTKNGTPITEKSNRDDVFNALNKDFEDRNQKLDIIFLQYAAKVKDVSTKKILENMESFEKKLDDFLNNKTVPTSPEYDKELLDNGSIDENFNTIDSVPDIAYFLMKHSLITDPNPKLLTRYKLNGESIKITTAREAIKTAKKRLRNGKK
jgi:hypothetical protein